MLNLIRIIRLHILATDIRNELLGLKTTLITTLSRGNLKEDFTKSSYKNTISLERMETIQSLTSYVILLDMT